MSVMQRTAVACLALCVLAVSGCGRSPAAMSVEELAAALQEHGIAYDVSETAALPRVRGEGLRLVGEDLLVEIYRIEDEEHLRLAIQAARLAAAVQRQIADARPLKYHVNEPFLIIVRQEPVEGQVEAALSRTFQQ